MLNGDCGYVVYKHREACHSPIVRTFNVVSHRTAVLPVLVLWDAPANPPAGNQN